MEFIDQIYNLSEEDNKIIESLVMMMNDNIKLRDEVARLEAELSDALEKQIELIDELDKERNKIQSIQNLIEEGMSAIRRM